MPEPVVALQMYTLRKEVAEDLVGTLERVAEIGYPAIQVGGLPQPPEAIRKVMDDLGLKVAGTHIDLARMENEFDKVVDEVKALGTEWVVVPYLPEERRRSGDDWRTLGKILTRIGARLKGEGLRLAYHNHAFEFQTFDGKYGYDILFESADLDVVQTEIDTYWVQYGGADPVAYLKWFAGHIQIVHFKDMGAGEDRPMVPVGEGILDWPAIIEACKSGGTEWICIEQDECAPLEPFEAARVSLENCRKWGLV